MGITFARFCGSALIGVDTLRGFKNKYEVGAKPNTKRCSGAQVQFYLSKKKTNLTQRNVQNLLF